MLQPLAPAVSHVTLATEHDRPEWDRYVATRPDATGYHEWAWLTVFSRAFGHEARALAAWSGDRIVGVLPMMLVTSPLFGRSLTSMAFVNYGGVLADEEAVGLRLIDEARDVARREKCPHVELRHLDRRFPSLPCRQHKVTMTLSLQDGMWDRLDRKVRNQIRKAQKSELVAVSGRNLLDEFYTVFSRNMRDLGTPVYSPRLFEEALAAFPDRANVHVVRLGDRPVAAGFTFRTGATVEVPWASSIRDFNALCPNHLLYWSILESAYGSGCTTLDFGRSTPNEGTFKFKAQWGAMPVPLHWEYILADGAELPVLAAANPRLRVMVEAWKRLPVPIAEKIGPWIVKGIP
jgi:serine/alanine adding enzyme